jgi:hypothetical protein
MRIWPASLLLLLTVGLAVAEPFQTLYVDAVWSKLTGSSTSQAYTTGLRQDDVDYYLTVTNNWSDTKGSDSLYQYTAQGTSLQAGARRWFSEKSWYGFVSAGPDVRGANSGELDYRAGVVGFKQWQEGTRLADLYGDMTFVHLSDDNAFLTLRPRLGHVLTQTTRSRTWVFGVAQLSASTDANSGVANRLEAGVGVGYWSIVGQRSGLSASVELRQGYSYRGAIADKFYFNPTVVIAGGF